MPPAEVKRSNSWILWGLALVALLVVISLVRRLTADTVEVRTSPVTHENLVSTVSTNGKVEPVEEFQPHAAVPGVVKEVLVESGEKVKEGQMLLRMDDADAVARIAQATSTVRTAEAAMSDMEHGGSAEERFTASGDVSRAKLQQQQAAGAVLSLRALEARGAASAGEVAAAQQRLEVANSTLQGAQARGGQRYSPTDKARVEAQLTDARANLAAAEASYAGENIRAPFWGTVYSVPVSAFDYVQAGEGLLDLADLNHIQVRAYFDEPEIGKLQSGQAVKIVWDAKPNQVWHGHIDRAPTTVTQYGNRNVGECVITVDDARGDLLPNTNVVVTVTTSQRFNVLSVPREALHTEGVSSFVYRVGNGKLQRTPVQVGALNNVRVEMLSGLTEKDMVVVSSTSSHELTNGIPVKIVE